MYKRLDSSQLDLFVTFVSLLWYLAKKKKNPQERFIFTHSFRELGLSSPQRRNDKVAKTMVAKTHGEVVRIMVHEESETKARCRALI